MTLFERYVTESAGVITLIDQYARDRGTRGDMPAPIPPLRFSLIRFDGTLLDPPIALIAQRSGSGSVYLFANEVRERRDEPAFRIVPGPYRLRIEGDYYQPRELDLDWPPSAQSLAPLFLLPGYNYPFPDVTLPSARVTLLRGTVLRGVSGSPVSNATVTITNPPNLGPFTTANTDPNGAWVLAFRHANKNPINATVRISIPNEPDVIVQNVILQAGQDNALSQTSLRGAVFTTRNTPVRGAEITVDIAPNQSVLTGGEGLWTFYFGVNQPDVMAQVTALAPNGDTDSVNWLVRNRATDVVPTFHIG